MEIVINYFNSRHHGKSNFGLILFALVTTSVLSALEVAKNDNIVKTILLTSPTELVKLVKLSKIKY